MPCGFTEYFLSLLLKNAKLLQPHYCVPSLYIEVESLPVSAAGKLDRKSLASTTSDRRALMRSLQLNFETHTVGSHAAPTPVHSSSSHSIRKLAKFLRVPSDSSLADVESVMIALWESILVTGDSNSAITLTSSFQEEGGHSLSAARLVAMLNKCFGVRLSAARLFQDNFTVENCCIEVMKQWSNSIEEKVEDNSESEESLESDRNEVISRVRNDASLPADITIQTGGNANTVTTARSVFLTGATGYLGAHILAQVLATNEIATVTCLVRSSDPNAVRKNCEKYGLSIDYSRVVLQRGDLSLSHLGMNNADWNRISASIDFIIHCGAMVSLTAPYEGKMRDINVGGTLETIRLAAACQEGTSLVYVSSNGIFPSCDEVFMENDNVACLPDRLGSHNGYGECMILNVFHHYFDYR